MKPENFTRNKFAIDAAGNRFLDRYPAYHLNHDDYWVISVESFLFQRIPVIVIDLIHLSAVFTFKLHGLDDNRRSFRLQWGSEIGWQVDRRSGYRLPNKEFEEVERMVISFLNKALHKKDSRPEC